MPGKSEGKYKSPACQITDPLYLTFVSTSSFTYFSFSGLFFSAVPSVTCLIAGHIHWYVGCGFLAPICLTVYEINTAPLLFHFQLYWGISDKYHCTVYNMCIVMIWSMYRLLKGWPPIKFISTSLNLHRYLLVWVREHWSLTLLANFNYII